MDNMDRYIEIAEELNFYQGIFLAALVLTYIVLMLKLASSSRKYKAYRKQNNQLMMLFSGLISFVLLSTLLLS